MIQYIELIERINLLLALFGSSIDTKGIIMEVSVGFLITVAGFMLLIPEKKSIVQEKKTPKIIYCSECGADILDKTRMFCSKCGAKIIN